MRGIFMRSFLMFLMVVLSGGLLSACVTGTKAEKADDAPVTIVYLVRHAEKEAGKDPALTPEGKARAERLAALLKSENVVKVYSTDTRRTRETADPVAKAFGLEIELYEPMHHYRMVDRIKGQPGVIVVVGHSNTIPAMAAVVAGKDETYPDFDESDYESLYWADISADGDVVVVKSDYARLAKRLK